MSRESGDQGEGRSVSHRQTDDDSDGAWCSGLANTIRDGVYRVDADRHITAVNDSLVDLTGYERQELLGAHLSVLFKDEAFARSELAIRRLWNGDDRDAESIGVAVTTADGEVVPCTLRVGAADGTEQRATVGVLREDQPEAPIRSESLSTSLTEGTDTFDDVLSRALTRVCDDTQWVYGDAWMPTEHGELTLVSSVDARADGNTDFVAASKSISFEPGRGLVGRVYESGDPEWIRDVTDAESGFHRAEAARESGLTTALGVPVTNETGVIAVLTFLLPEQLAVNQQMVDLVTSMANQLGDVLHESHRERRRWQHYQQFEQMIDAVEEYAIFMLDADGRVVTWNEGAHRLKGYEASEIIGTHFSEFYTADDRDAGIPARNLAEAAKEDHVETEGWRVRQDGSRFWANVVITAIRDDDGTLQGYTKVTKDTTERREYEQQLEFERNVTERILDAAPVAVAVIERDGEIVRANQHASKLTGIDLDAGSTEISDLDVFDEDGQYLPPAERPYMEVFETGQAVIGERIRLDTQEQGTRWLSVNAVPIHDEDEQVTQVVVAADDVTQLKEQAHRLQQERDTLESEMTGVFERVTDAFMALDDEWRFTYVNEQAEQLLEASKSDLLGATIWEEFPEISGSRFQEEYERAMDEQEPVSFEEYYPPLDTWFAVNVYPSESGLSVYFRDVTERKAREAEVRHQRDRAQTILELAGSVMVIVGEDGTVSYINQRGCEVLDYEKEDLLGEDWVDTCIPERNRDDAREMFEGVRSGAEDVESHVGTVRTADGEERTIKWNNTALREDGEVAGTLSAGTDITERIRRENRLQRYSDYLNQFYHTSTRADIDFDEKVEQLLSAGCEFLGFDIGILSEIDGGEYHIQQVSDQTGAISVGDSYALADTYCELTIQQTQPLGFEDAADVDLASHPCYQEFGLQSYLGVPVHVNGELHGTLNFSSPDTRDQEISELDRTFMTLLSQWIGYELGRKQREHELEEYEQVMETIDDGVYVVDEDTRFVFVNQAYAEMTGYTREELIGESAEKVVSEETAKEVMRAYQELHEEGRETTTIEGPMQRADGTSFPAEGTISVMEFSDGTLGRVGVVRDITDRKEFEETLQALHSTTRDLYEATSADAVSERVVDAATDVLDLSGVAVYLHDEERDELYPAAVSSGSAFMQDEELPSVPADESTLTGHIYVSGESASLEDIRDSSYMSAENTDMRAGVFVPLGDHGVAIVGSRDVDVFDTETEQLVELLATNAESALDRIERERALEESQQRYRTLVDNFPNGGVALFDDDLRYLVVGGQLSQYGLEPEDMEGSRIQDSLPEPLAEEIEPHYSAAIEGESHTFEVEHDDHIRQFHSLPVRDDEGTIIAGMAMSQDVTELRERERQLARFKRAVEASGHAIYMTDTDGTITYVNPAFEEITGYSEAEAVGRTPAILQSGEHGDGYYRTLWETIQRGEVWDEEIIDRRKSGELYHAEQTIAPVTDESGTVDRLVAVQTDITDRKERERELQTRVRQQQVVTRLGQRALAADDLDALFEEAVDLVAETLDSDYCKVLDQLPDGEGLLLRSGVGWRDGLVGSATVPTDRGSQAGYTLLSEEPVVVPDMEAETRFSGPELLTSHDVESGISVIIGPPESPWGILGTHDTEKREFSEHDVNFVQSVANILTTAIDRVEHERQIERQRERLAALNNLNGIIRDIIRVLIQQSTREDVEELVCERLADSESYEFAWVGEVDANTDEVVLREEAGVENYLDDITITVDDSEGSRGPTGQALRTGEVQICQDVTTDPDYEQWRDRALEYGYRSSAAIPITYENTTYGVLNLYADRPFAFSGEERAVIEQLGEVMGHAINAIERKRLLMSDEVVEVEFRIRDLFDEFDLDGDPEGEFTFQQTIPTSQGYLAYGTVSDDGVETLERLVEQLPAWEDVSFISEGLEGSRRFELKLTDPPALDIVTAHGGHIPSATFAKGDYRMTVELPPDAPVRSVVDAVQDAYPATELLAQRRTASERDVASPHQVDLADLLTERQFAALEAAYFAGFFEWPRESTGEDVADALDISAPTFHQHLRGAERRLLTSIIDGEPPE